MVLKQSVWKGPIYLVRKTKILKYIIIIFLNSITYKQYNSDGSGIYNYMCSGNILEFSVCYFNVSPLSSHNDYENE